MMIQPKTLLALILLGLVGAVAAAQASQVKLRALDGPDFDLAQKRGRVVVLAFGATWNPMARRSKPALQQLAERYTQRNVDFYWVSVNSADKGKRNYASDEDLRKFTEQHGLRVPILRDPERMAYRALAVDALPTLVFINSEGVVCRRFTGFNLEQPNGYQEAERYLFELLK
jgi:peroxiredoxin